MKEIALRSERVSSGHESEATRTYSTHEQLRTRLLYCALPLTKYGHPIFTSKAGATVGSAGRSARSARELSG
jgi:hypothetical protein